MTRKYMNSLSNSCWKGLLHAKVPSLSCHCAYVEILFGSKHTRELLRL